METCETCIHRKGMTCMLLGQYTKVTNTCKKYQYPVKEVKEIKRRSKRKRKPFVKTEVIRTRLSSEKKAMYLKVAQHLGKTISELFRKSMDKLVYRYLEKE